MSSSIEVTNGGDNKRKLSQSSAEDDEPAEKKSIPSSDIPAGNGSVIDPKSDSTNGDGVTESVHIGLADLGRFQMRRILRNDASQRVVAVEAGVQGSAQPAVLLLEKLPFEDSAVAGMLADDTKLAQQFHNDVYGSYTGLLPSQQNPIKVTLIHPATEKHLEKHSVARMLMVDETPALYQNALLPYVAEKRFNHEWVYNILEHRSEAERIVYEDKDDQSGFVIVPDLKWDGVNLASLYLMAIVRRRDLASIRDLNESHLPLLRNISSNGIDAVLKRYGLHRCDIRAYFHYLPSYYHLHVHITAVNFDAPGRHVGRAHLLSTVINNIELMSDFYQRATLSYFIRDIDSLVQYYRKSGYDFPSLKNDEKNDAESPDGVAA